MIKILTYSWENEVLPEISWLVVNGRVSWVRCLSTGVRRSSSTPALCWADCACNNVLIFIFVSNGIQTNFLRTTMPGWKKKVELLRNFGLKLRGNAPLQTSDDPEVERWIFNGEGGVSFHGVNKHFRTVQDACQHRATRVSCETVSIFISPFSYFTVVITDHAHLLETILLPMV